MRIIFLVIAMIAVTGMIENEHFQHTGTVERQSGN